MTQDVQLHRSMRRLADVLPVRKDAEPSQSITDGLVAQILARALPGIAGLLPGMRCEPGPMDSTVESSPKATTDIVVEARFSGHDPALVLRMARKTLFALENVMLGGRGDDATGRLDRKLTQLDRKLVHAVAEVLFNAFAAAANEKAMPLSVSSIEVATDGKQSSPSTGDGFAVALELCDEESALPIMIHIPWQLLEVESQDWPGDDAGATDAIRSDIDDRAMKLDAFPQTPVVVDVAIEALEMSLAEVNAIRPGDTLALIADSASRVVLECEGLALFTGTVGHRGGEILVRIDEPLDHNYHRVAGRGARVSENGPTSEQQL